MSDELIAKYHDALIDDLISLGESEGDEMMEVEEFGPYLRKQMLLAGLDTKKLDRALEKARRESDALT